MAGMKNRIYENLDRFDEKQKGNHFPFHVHLKNKRCKGINKRHIFRKTLTSLRVRSVIALNLELQETRGAILYTTCHMNDRNSGL